jgi:hypothetical protein
MCELRERVLGVMHDRTYNLYVVRRENVTGSLQIRFMGRVGGRCGIRETCNSALHLSFLAGRI